MKTCLYCGSTLTGNQKKFCSKKCDDKWKYENNRAYTICLMCGETFDYPAKKVSNKPKYCSRACADKARRKPKVDANKTRRKPRVDADKTFTSDSDLANAFLKLENPIFKGAVSQYLAQAYFSLKGWTCYQPTHESDRVDYVVFDGSSYKKVQVKTIYQYGDKFRCELKKQGKNNKLLKYTPEELDILVAYCPQFNAIIEVPGELVYGKSSITFSAREQGYYCSTSRFIEDFIVLRL